MPIEVRELLIKVNVTSPPADSPARGAAAPPQQAIPTADRRAIIDECVERVLDALREREEP